MHLRIEHFAQIEEAGIDFGQPGDLTVLVGQQATGKSLILQWLKLLTDRICVRTDWERFGINWKSAESPVRPIDLFFGEGLGGGYSADKTSIRLDGKAFPLASLFNFSKGQKASSEIHPETTYYIPAHRALLLADGWPLAFQQHRVGTPYVARAQSERLLQWLNRADAPLYPLPNRLHADLRSLFDEAIFHGACLNVDRTSPQSRIVLAAGSAKTIPYMAWTAGQREFVPLLLALYELLPAGAISRLERFGTVILEEPELGLHPKALFAVGVAILHLLARGYRVAVSSHSPLMVEFAWTLNRLRVAARHGKASDADYRKAFGLRGNPATNRLIDRLRRAKARVYYTRYRPGSSAVVAEDISSLRLFDDTSDFAWGELLKYSNRLADVIGQLEMNFSALSEQELVN